MDIVIFDVSFFHVFERVGSGGNPVADCRRRTVLATGYSQILFFITVTGNPLTAYSPHGALREVGNIHFGSPIDAGGRALRGRITRIGQRVGTNSEIAGRVGVLTPISTMLIRVLAFHRIAAIVNDQVSRRSGYYSQLIRTIRG